MPVHSGSVLVDTNAIIEAHEKGCWSALSARYEIETVEKCLEETQTGFQGRPAHLLIEPAPLRASLSQVHPVSILQLAELALLGGPFLDDGEKALWAHALSRPPTDTWILCGPDKASMKFGFQQGQRARLVSLGGLLADIGHRPTRPLKPWFEKRWLDETLTKLALGLMV